MTKLPEGIGFTESDCKEFAPMAANRIYAISLEDANARLPALFEAWVRREGLDVYSHKVDGDWCEWGSGDNSDTHQGYVVLIEELRGAAEITD